MSMLRIIIQYFTFIIGLCLLFPRSFIHTPRQTYTLYQSSAVTLHHSVWRLCLAAGVMHTLKESEGQVLSFNGYEVSPKSLTGWLKDRTASIAGWLITLYNCRVCVSTCVSQSAVCISLVHILCAPKLFFSIYHNRITLERCSYAFSYYRAVRKYFLLMRALEVVTLVYACVCICI